MFMVCGCDLVLLILEMNVWPPLQAYLSLIGADVSRYLHSLRRVCL